MKQAILHIHDEVNIKIEGLDLDIRKVLVNAFKYENPAARYMPAVRLGRWDGKVAYFQLGGSTYTNLLPEILPILERFDYDVELNDQRTYSTTFDFTQATENTFSNQVWGPGHPAAGEPVMLRDYQVEIINTFLTNTQCVQEVATGAGKTIMTAALSWNIQPYGRSIVIVPNKSLVTQTEKDYVNLGLDTGVYFGDRKDYNCTHTICTWQSLNNLLKETKSGSADFTIQDFLEDVVCVIVDECFDGDTLITTPGGKVPIKKLKAGDKVINFCEKAKQYKEDVVIKVHKNLPNSYSERMLELEFNNGTKTQVTANHKFLTNNGWVKADELTNDMEIIDINTYS